MVFMRILILALITIIPSSSISAQSKDPLAKDSPDHTTPVRVASALMKVFDIVLDQHLNPLTRQQMMQDSIEAAYRNHGGVMPASVSLLLSNAKSRQEQQDILVNELVATQELDTASESNDDNNRENLPHQLERIGVQIKPLRFQRVAAQTAANRYVGIGIAITKSGGYPSMASILPGGAAERAQSAAGDQIVGVGDRTTRGIPLETVVEWIRGEEGTEVELTLRRGGIDRRVTMTRGVVPMKTIRLSKNDISDSTIGITLTRLSASNVHELRKIANTLEDSITRVVLDFRTSLDASHLHYGKLLANALINDRDIGHVVDRNQNAQMFHAEPGAVFSNRDLYVVIDHRTGPVLKWVAAAIQDTKSGTLIGLPATTSSITTEAFEIPEDGIAVVLPTRQLSRANGQWLTTRSGFQSNFSTSIPKLQWTPLVTPEQGVVYPDLALNQKQIHASNGGHTTLADVILRLERVVAQKTVDLRP